jgi:hypothetical protein
MGEDGLKRSANAAEATMPPSTPLRTSDCTPVEAEPAA